MVGMGSQPYHTFNFVFKEVYFCPPPKQEYTFLGPMRRFTIKVKHICEAVREILRYKQTHIILLYYFRIFNNPKKAWAIVSHGTGKVEVCNSIFRQILDLDSKQNDIRYFCLQRSNPVNILCQYFHYSIRHSKKVKELGLNPIFQRFHYEVVIFRFASIMKNSNIKTTFVCPEENKAARAIKACINLMILIVKFVKKCL